MTSSAPDAPSLTSPIHGKYRDKAKSPPENPAATSLPLGCRTRAGGDRQWHAPFPMIDLDFTVPPTWVMNRGPFHVHPSEALMSFAAWISCAACCMVMALPDWACTSLMKAPMRLHAVIVSPAFVAARAACAFCSLASR